MDEFDSYEVEEVGHWLYTDILSPVTVCLLHGSGLGQRKVEEHCIHQGGDTPAPSTCMTSCTCHGSKSHLITSEPCCCLRSSQCWTVSFHQKMHFIRAIEDGGRSARYRCLPLCSPFHDASWILPSPISRYLASRWSKEWIIR